MTRKKSVLIIDDHPLFREGLKAIIERDDGYEVAGEAGDGREGLRLARKHRPDLAVVDISLPDKDGIQLTREIQASDTETQILIVSMHANFDYISAAFRAGAGGYMVKESASSRLLQALDSVAKGEMFLDGLVSSEVVRRLTTPSESEGDITDTAYNSLTQREQEVMRFLAQGLPSDEVAERLAISRKTVDNHRSNIMRKLNLKNGTQLVHYAARLGLIEMEQWKA
ncbi:MAG: response regulator transcription factor [bacterium]|nr:response regulator transcription factor [bacterium]